MSFCLIHYIAIGLLRKTWAMNVTSLSPPSTSQASIYSISKSSQYHIFHLQTILLPREPAVSLPWWLKRYAVTLRELASASEIPGYLNGSRLHAINSCKLGLSHLIFHFNHCSGFASTTYQSPWNRATHTRRYQGPYKSKYNTSEVANIYRFTHALGVGISARFCSGWAQNGIYIRNQFPLFL